MKFKHEEAAMIWEGFRNPMEEEDLDFGMEDDSMMDDMGMEDDFGDDPEVVMELEPMAPVETIGDEEMTEILKIEMKKLIDYSDRLNGLVGSTEFEPWMIAKIVKASDYLDDVWHRLDVEADFANTGFDQASEY